MAGDFRNVFTILNEDANVILDSLQSEFQAFDFNKIIPLPKNYSLMSVYQSREALFYYLTNRMTSEITEEKYNQYFNLNSDVVIMPPSISDMHKYTLKYIEMFDESGSFKTTGNGGFYHFYHIHLDQLFLTGQAIAEMVDLYATESLTGWKLKYWGCNFNALCSIRIKPNAVSFETTSDRRLLAVHHLIEDKKLDCTIETSSWLDKEYLRTLHFRNGVQV